MISKIEAVLSRRLKYSVFFLIMLSFFLFNETRYFHWCECLSKVRIGIQIVVLSLVSILDYMSCGFWGERGLHPSLCIMSHSIIKYFSQRKYSNWKWNFCIWPYFSSALMCHVHLPLSLKDKRWERFEKIFKIIRRVKINYTSKTSKGRLGPPVSNVTFF